MKLLQKLKGAELGKTMHRDACTGAQAAGFICYCAQSDIKQTCGDSSDVDMSTRICKMNPPGVNICSQVLTHWN